MEKVKTIEEVLAIDLVDNGNVVPVRVNSIKVQNRKEASNPFENLSWNELDALGKLPDLKEAQPEVFKAKFKEKFGTDYKEADKEQKVEKVNLANPDELKEEWARLSWDEMDKKGKLPKLLAEFPDLFRAKYKVKFGKEYQSHI